MLGATPESNAMNTKRVFLSAVGRLAVTLIAYLILPAASIAAPPENFDSSLASWFHDLKAPNGSGCCDLADCRRTESRITEDGYEAIIDDTWVAVPWDRVLRRTDNPTGTAIVCRMPHTKIILCFVRPPDT
jgi:hypothetical protein